MAATLDNVNRGPQTEVPIVPAPHVLCPPVFLPQQVLQFTTPSLVFGSLASSPEANPFQLPIYNLGLQSHPYLQLVANTFLDSHSFIHSFTHSFIH